MTKHTYVVQLGDFPEKVITARTKGEALKQYIQYLRYEVIDPVRYNVQKIQALGVKARKLEGLFI